MESYAALDDHWQTLWDKKAASINKNDNQDADTLFFDKAAIYAEFGKVIVIGLGMVTMNAQGLPTLRVKALSGHDEKALLQDFCNMIAAHFSQEVLQLCAHNGKEFDFPYLCRRMVVQGIPLPPVLDVAGKKPWEVAHLDTMELWKFGDRKSFTSLDLLATLLGVTSSKTIMDGSQVNHYYYREKALDKISTYCLQDVIATAQVFLKMNLLAPIPQERIIFA